MELMEDGHQVCPVIKKEEPYDPEWEQNHSDIRGGFDEFLKTTLWPKTTKEELHSQSQSEVFVLSEFGPSDRAGRACRPLRCQPKIVSLSDESYFKTEEPSIDLNTNETNKVASEKLNCKFCGVEHSCKAELRSHMKKHKQVSTDAESLKYVCELCGVKYVRKRNLTDHMRIHTGETPYECKVCGKGFRRSDWLAKHVKIHEKKEGPRKGQKKPRKTSCYRCDYCGRTYQSTDSLRYHLRKHSGKRPYECPICKMTFYWSATLKGHLECHSDDRPYICSECGSSFKRLGTLNKHKRIHTGEKPFSCNYCGKKFPYQYSRMMHMKICQLS